MHLLNRRYYQRKRVTGNICSYYTVSLLPYDWVTCTDFHKVKRKSVCQRHEFSRNKLIYFRKIIQILNVFIWLKNMLLRWEKANFKQKYLIHFRVYEFFASICKYKLTQSQEREKNMRSFNISIDVVSFSKVYKLWQAEVAEDHFSCGFYPTLIHSTQMQKITFAP